MGNVPVIHEVSTSFLSLGDAIVGDTEKARERWDTYAKESIVGSYVAGTVEAFKGNEEKSLEYLKGMGRATGKAVLGGGLLRDVPVFHEIAVCGESLGDMIGGGDDESARERWKTYSESSVIGSGLGALAAKIDGDDEEAERLAEGCGKAGARFGVTAVAVGSAVATGGLAAPLGVAASVTSGAVVGMATGAGSTAVVQLIDHDKITDPGAIVGMGLFGAASGAVSGAEAAKKAKAAKAVKEAAKRSENASSSSLSCAKSKSSSSSNGNQAPDKPSPSSGSSSTKPKPNSSSNGNQAPKKPSPSSGSSSSQPKNNSARPRPQSYSVYQDGEHFTSDSMKNAHEMYDTNSFSHKGGTAQRNSRFRDVWEPKDSKSMPDRNAAAEAARRDVESSVKNLGNKNRPGMITVTKDLESGSATSSASVKGNIQKSKFGDNMGWHQKKLLDIIDPESRGKGHGFCGEQVGYNNSRAYRNKSENLFQNRGKVSMEAYAQQTKGIYTNAVDPCQTCERVPGEIFRRRSGP